MGSCDLCKIFDMSYSNDYKNNYLFTHTDLILK